MGDIHLDLEAHRAETIYLTDLDRVLPESAVSAQARRQQWRTLSYRADTLSGAMLVAGDLTDAAEVNYPLHLEGWYAISIGLIHERGFDNLVQVKLSADPCFTILSLRPGSDPENTLPAGVGRWTTNIQELFWKSADLTGQSMHFRQLCTYALPGNLPDVNHYAKAGIAYIKLVPLSATEVAAHTRDRQRKDTRRLYAHHDASSYQFYYLVATPEDVWREIEPFRHTDFSRLYWEVAYGDLQLYLGKAGRLPTFDGVENFFHAGERMCAETWRTFRDKGIDQLKLATDFAHDAGLELHASFRPAGFIFTPLSENNYNWQGYYKQHPELRGVARDGSRSPRISYTYPETRQYVLSLLREIAQYPVDGICLLYVRRPPLVEYEPPLIEGFMAEYGADPRQLDEEDPRWLSYRCKVLTGFMQDLRQEMEAVAREQGRGHIEISVVISGREGENLLNGIDVQAWIEGGLVDTVIPYTMAPRLDSSQESWPDLQAIDNWAALTQGTNCKLAPNILPRIQTGAAYRHKAAAIYGRGVEQLFFWDCNSRANFNPSWDALRSLGHREEIDAWIRDGEPSLKPAYTILRDVNDWPMAYDTPG
ncbi:MAG: hypothetical protein EXR62_03440 [Chloroflexi bacterium]|nr:hypothetical protein [Chloroflexota bacterium]